MPILNEFILESICNEIIQENTEENLLKFMLSGKEIFKFAVNYFKRANAVEFLRLGFIVQVNNISFKISYDYVLFKLIKKAIENSSYLKEVVIGQCPFTDAGEIFLNNLIQKDFKIFGLREKAPERYVEIIKNKTTIEEIRMLVFVTYNDLSIVPSSCQILKVFFKPNEMMKKIPENLNLNQIKDVFVLDTTNYDLSPCKVYSFKHFVKTCFPYLTPSVACVCTTQAVCVNIQKVFTAQLFAAVSSTKTNKSVCFCSRSLKDYTSMAIKLYGFPIHSFCKSDTRGSVHGCLLEHFDPTLAVDK